ncbi:MAG: hypothetical protein LBO65_02420, partial [Spirochaetaceae bacterium]|nr:hypothetical protein [Spirochaetaceae bacterium]
NVWAASFDQSNVAGTGSGGSGLTTFTGPQNYTGGFKFIGTDLTVNNTLQTDTDDTGDGNITVNAGSGAGTFTVGASGNIQPGGTGAAGGKITVTGNTANNGIITAAVTSISEPIEFNGNYTSASGATLTGSTNTAAQTIVFRGNAAFGNFTHNGDTVWFSGSAHSVSQAGTTPPVLADVVIDTGNTVTVSSGRIDQDPAGTGRTLTLTGTASLNTTAGSWYIGPPALPSPWHMLSNPSGSPGPGVDLNYQNPGPQFTGGFAGFNGNLIMGNGSTLTTKDFYTQMTNAGSNEFTLTAPSGASEMCHINASGNVTVNESFVNVANSTLTMTGSGGKLAVRSHAASPTRAVDVRLGDFVADGGSTAANATIINSDVIFVGENAVTIKTGKFLTTYSGARIQVNPVSTDASWVQEGGATFDLTGEPLVEFGVKGYAAPPGRTFSISGNTTWAYLLCNEPMATLKFSNYPDTHKVEKAFTAEPQDASGHLIYGGGIATNPYMIRLTRLTYYELTPPAVGLNPDTRPPPSVTNRFWYFELKSGAELYFEYVYVQYSWAKNRIPLPLARQSIILGTPYVYLDPPHPGTPDYDLANPRTDPTATFDTAVKKSYYNHNWLVANNFFYSFTEDSDHNGRIDRIRVQAAFDLTDGTTDHAFDDFRVVVDGYTVDTSMGVNGCVRVDEDPAITPAVADSVKDMIYIYLVEKDYSDTGARLTWRVERNTTLKDLTTKSIEVGLPEHGTMTTWDTAPPRINYALTLPDDGTLSEEDAIYVRFSEPVEGPSVVTTVPSPPTAGLVAEVGAEKADRLISISRGYTVDELVKDNPLYPEFTVTGVRDNAVFAEDVRSSSSGPYALYAYLYPSPKYPVTWEYTEYEEITGSPASPPFQLIDGSTPTSLIKDWSTAVLGNRLDNDGDGSGSPGNLPYGEDTHRVTDVLISVPPVQSSAPRYFVWPLWAKYTNLDPEPYGGEPGGVPAPGYGYMHPDGNRAFSDSTVIWDFTGKRFLEREDITLQARFGNGLISAIPPITDIDLVFAFDVPPNYRRGHGETDLWLPKSLSTNFFNLVPLPYDMFPPPLDHDTFSGQLFTYKFSQSVLHSKSNLEFFFHLNNTPPDLFAGRLDIAPGEPIPSDWYNRVKPFVFGIHDITRQRGGVTILNNVINSTKREHVFLDYKLDKAGRVTVQVFTLDGNLVKVLVRENQSAKESYYRVSWDGTNSGGRPVARGMYFIRIVAPDIDEIRKVMVVK